MYVILQKNDLYIKMEWHHMFFQNLIIKMIK